MYETQKIKHEIEIKGFNGIFYFEFGKNFTHAPEKHDFWEMVYVDNGRIIAIANGVGFSLEQGQAIFHEPGEAHAHVSDTQVANNMLVVAFSSGSNIMEYFRRKTFTLDKASQTLLSLFLEEAKNALGKIPGDYNSETDLRFLPDVFGSTQMLECYFTEFLIRLVRSGQQAAKKLPSNEKSRTVANNSLAELICEYMKHNIYSGISLSEICAKFLFGKTQLCKIFRENTGQSPMEYYSELRISEAKKLIRENNLSVSQISDMLGYSSIHTFSRAFKKETGLSPVSYRKSIL